MNLKTKEQLLKTWEPTIMAEGLNDIKNEDMKVSLAQVLDNTYNSLLKSGFNPKVITEAFDNGVNDMRGIKTTDVDGSNSAEFSPTQQDWKQGDVRIPLAVMPLCRRMFTQLIAHELVGVQAMSAPSGYAVAYRYMYGSGNEDNSNEMIWGKFDPAFSGTLEYAGALPESATAIQSLEAMGMEKTTQVVDGETVVSFKKPAGMDAGVGERKSFRPDEGESMIAKASIRLEKVLVAAKTRKIGTSISMEEAEDLLVTLGLDINESMLNLLTLDIKNSIDRELLDEIILGTIGTAEKAAKGFSVWDASLADGIDQMSRLSTLYTHILQRSKKIQYNTKMGNGANWMIASSPVAGLVERIGDWKLADNDVSIDGAAIAYAGTLRRGSIKVYNDALTENPYILLGWKGNDITQTGVVYLPYVAAQLLSGPDTDKFGARLMARSRYAIVNSLFGTENFYQFIQLQNCTDAKIEIGAAKQFVTF